MNEIQIKYRSNFIRRMILGSIFVSIILLSFSLKESGVLSQSAFIIVLIFGVVGYNAINVVFWKCPSCGFHFGKFFFPSHCPHCAVELRPGKKIVLSKELDSSILQAKYQKILKRQKIVGILFLAFMVPLVFVVYVSPEAFHSKLPEIGFISLSLSVASILLFTLYNWRCPACKKMIGKNSVVKTCIHCGTKLN